MRVNVPLKTKKETTLAKESPAEIFTWILDELFKRKKERFKTLILKYLKCFHFYWFMFILDGQFFLFYNSKKKFDNCTDFL